MIIPEWMLNSNEELTEEEDSQMEGEEEAKIQLVTINLLIK
jgi:hypothetical protein